MSKKTDDAVLAPAVPEGQMRETAEALADRPDHRDTNWNEANFVVGEGEPKPKAAKKTADPPKAEAEPEPKPTAKTAAKKTAAKAAAKKSTDPAGAGAEGTTKKEK